MAAIDSYSKKPRQKHQISDQKKDNPTKFHYNFLHKALTISLFLIILPLFPSQAPEFINQTLLTRSWELLHLLFVGIAISYGLFSRKNDNDNDDDDKDDDNNNKFENAQNYVSRFLHVSSVFDNDSENPSVSDESKVQTWSSQYLRNEPLVVVAQESKKNVSKSVEKPLLLPVRSLKETSAVSDLVSRSYSRRFLSNSKTKNGEFGALEDKELMEEKVKKGSVVLPSPIPWRSRSGRMEMKEEQEEESLESHARFFPMDEPEFSRFESRVKRSQSSRSSRPNSANSSPKISPSPSAKKTSPLPSSFSLESQAKIAEGMVKKKSFYNKTNPPPAPPPPPPPPPFYLSSSTNEGFQSVSSEKEAKKKVGFDQTFFKSEEEEEDLEEKVFMESDLEESESEDYESEKKFSPNFNGESSAKINEESGSSGVADEGPDVDKKADEFIAKFREQIRLQRIESIKRSTAQISRKLSG